MKRYRHKRKRSTRRNKGKVNRYARFVQSHKGYFKKHSFKAATKMIAALYRKSR